MKRSSRRRWGPFKFKWPTAALVAGALAAPAAVANATEPMAQIPLEERARGILKTHCIECHGGKFIRAGFDVSSHRSLMRGGESGLPAIDPDNPPASLLLQKIRHTADPPMPYKRPKLADGEIALIEEWISAGAPYSQPLIAEDDKTHWSLRPIVKPEPPHVDDETWQKSPVDRFVLAMLKEKEMHPSPPADKRTLLRRIYFNLTGLPPTPEQHENFIADSSPDAWARVVDELLASPRYGERWARHWLDVVHYADTHGHDQDAIRENAWPYRDYVIESFNNDKPYARFVEEQLAADVLYPETPAAIAALGFLAAGPWDESTLKDIREDTIDRQMGRYMDRDDIVTTTLSTFASTTAHCARCHDHKFDPISQQEYYNLQAVFAGTDRADRTFDPDPAVAAERKSLAQRKLALENHQAAEIDALVTPAIRSELAEWEQTILNKNVAWTVLDPVSFTSSHGARLSELPDHSVLSSGERPEKDVLAITAVARPGRISAVRIEALTDDNLPHKGPGRQDNGNFTLSEFRLLAAVDPSNPELTEVALQNPGSDYDQPGWTVAHAVDGNASTGWGIYPEVGKTHAAAFELQQAIEAENGTPLTFVLEQVHGGGHLIGRVRLSVTDAPLPVHLQPVPESLAHIFALPKAHRSNDQNREVAVYYLKLQIERKLAALPPSRLVYAGTNDFTPIGSHMPAVTPRPVHFLKRGDINKPGELASPGALACVAGVPAEFDISDPADEGLRRAALAKWMTHPENTLVWRSIANRVWHYHFGRGICDTPNDFGRMGTAPSHPELLDWLAASFRDGGGSIKELHRLILNSATYRQASNYHERFSGIDSANVYLWRMNRRRLDAESVRDAVLQITGQLDLTMGGPSVKQFSLSPGIHVTPLIDYANFDLDSVEGRRRSIYRLVFRSLPDPFMDAMDCADASQLTAVRNESITALQALAMLNNRFIVRQSEHFSNRLLQMEQAPESRVTGAYRLALGRAPTPAESEAMTNHARQHGLANTCRLIFNTNEFLFLD